MKNKTIKITVLFSIIIVLVVIAIVLGVALPNSDVALGFSIASAIVGVVLSGVAIVYTFISGIKLDDQLSKLSGLVKSLQTERTKIEDKISELTIYESALTPELQDKLNQFKKDMRISVDTLYDDISK